MRVVPHSQLCPHWVNLPQELGSHPHAPPRFRSRQQGSIGQLETRSLRGEAGDDGGAAPPLPQGALQEVGGADTGRRFFRRLERRQALLQVLLQALPGRRKARPKAGNEGSPPLQALRGGVSPKPLLEELLQLGLQRSGQLRQNIAHLGAPGSVA